MSSAIRVSTEEPFQLELQINAEVEADAERSRRSKRRAGKTETSVRTGRAAATLVVQSQSWSWKVSRVIVGLLGFLLFFAKTCSCFTPVEMKQKPRPPVPPVVYEALNEDTQ